MRLPETLDRRPRRGLTQPGPGAAGTFTSLWGKPAQHFETRH